MYKITITLSDGRRVRDDSAGVYELFRALEKCEIVKFEVELKPVDQWNKSL